MVAVCLGSGPSLSEADVLSCRGRAMVIAINTTYTMAPWAEFLFAADLHWWVQHKGAPDFLGHKVGLDSRTTERFPDVRILRQAGKMGLSLDPEALCTGDNSGYAAINFAAVVLQAKRILLLGYDMHPAPNGRHHWHPEHVGNKHSNYQKCLQHFETLKEPLTRLGVSVLNCTRSSSLNTFPRLSLEAAWKLPTP